MSMDKKSFKRFGITIGIVFTFIALFSLLKNRQNNVPIFISLSIVFFLLAFTLPVLLKPIYIIWMKLAFLLAWVNTWFILFVIFYLVLTPTGLLMKLFRFDPLERRIDKKKASYWIKKEVVEFNRLNYERQF